MGLWVIRIMVFPGPGNFQGYIDCKVLEISRGLELSRVLDFSRTLKFPGGIALEFSRGTKTNHKPLVGFGMLVAMPFFSAVMNTF